MSQSRIYLSPPDVSETERQYLLDAFDSNWISPLGPHVDAFEREFAANVQMPAAVALSSGTAALHLAMKALGIKHGDSVLVSTLTFAATANPVTYLGATPVFIDANPDTWTMDPELLAEEIQARVKRGRKPAAVITVDLYGQSCDYDPIIRECDRHGIPVIADAAEAVGTFYKGRPAGNFGACAAFSFNSNKIITTGGGGMLVSTDRVLADRVRYLSTQARDPVPHYQHAEVGFNYRMSNLLAAIGRGQLADLSRKVARRREINQRYREAFGSREGVSFMPEASYGKSNCWLTAVLIDPSIASVSREDVRRHLESLSIESRPVWKPMHLQPAFAHCEHRGGDVSESLFERGLCLPSGSSLTDSELGRVIDAVSDLFERRWFVQKPGASSIDHDEIAVPSVAPVLPAPPKHVVAQPAALVSIKRLVLRTHRFWAIALQLGAMAFSNYAAMLLRFDGAPPSWAMAAFWETVTWLVALRALVFIPLGLYQGLWRYTSLYDLERLMLGIIASSVLFGAYVLSPLGPVGYPRSTILIDAILLTLLLSGLRMARRFYTDARTGRTGARTRVLIYGGGSAGEMVAREMRMEHALGYTPVGFVDDDPNMLGRRIHGIKVLGSRQDLSRIVAEHRPTEVLIAMPSIDPAELNKIVRTLQPLGVAIKTLPHLRHIISGKEVTTQVRGLAIEDLITRVPNNLDPNLLRAFIEGQSVLVTGAGGSVGAELCRQIARLGPARLVALDRHETSLKEIVEHVQGRSARVEVRGILADVADREAMADAFAKARPSIVFHAAGYAHGSLIEDNPFEAIRNNVQGTRVVAETACRAGVDRVFLMSTFKAANPSGILGVTKRLAELTLLAHSGSHDTSLSCIRFGNVLGSNGSVVPRFVSQIHSGGPVTVTDPAASRYFMLLPDAIQLVLYATAQARDGEVYAIDMGDPVGLIDIASNLIRLAGLTPHVDINIQISGLRPGEKVTDEIAGADESLEPTSTSRVWRIASPRRPAEEILAHIDRLDERSRAGRMRADALMDEIGGIL